MVIDTSAVVAILFERKTTSVTKRPSCQGFRRRGCWRRKVGQGAAKRSNRVSQALNRGQAARMTGKVKRVAS